MSRLCRFNRRKDLPRLLCWRICVAPTLGLRRRNAVIDDIDIQIVLQLWYGTSLLTVWTAISLLWRGKILVSKD